MSPRAFEEQVRHALGAGYAPATADEVLPGSGKLVHVTFDDAFRSIGGALDQLAALGVPATVFACSDYADEGRPLEVGDLARDGAPVRERRR